MLHSSRMGILPSLFSDTRVFDSERILPKESYLYSVLIPCLVSLYFAELLIFQTVYSFNTPEGK